MFTPEEQAEFLMRKISPISEIKMRTIVLAQELGKLEEDVAVEVIRIILLKGAQGIERFQIGVKSLRDVEELERQMGVSKISDIYSLSMERGYHEIVRMLSSIPAKKKAEDHPEDVYVDIRFKDVPLGVKKSLGRLGDRDLINRLLHEQEPSVIEQILNNPGLTEDQVVRIAAKRPTSDKVLRVIAQNKKWSSRYRVQRALASNPYTPTEISIRLITMMMKQDLVEIRDDTSLHIELRKAAAELIKKKFSSHEPEDEE